MDLERTWDVVEYRFRLKCGGASRFGNIVFRDSGWDGSNRMLIDRLVHHCHLVTIRGNSYRMRQHTELWHALHADPEPKPAAKRRRRSQQEVATN